MKSNVIRLALVVALAFYATMVLHAEKVPVKAPEATPAEHPVNVTIIDASTDKQDIDKLVKQGSTNIIDVFSEACPPCRRLSPLLNKLAEKKPELQIVKLDIGVTTSGTKRGINWGAPVIEQYGIRGIPYLMIYDEKGQKKSEGDPAFEEVVQWLKDAGIATE